MPKRVPDRIDRHVGGRVRMRRMLAGMSQHRLGEALGVTFQQVQKYEKGLNRIGASRLQRIAGMLDVSVSFFFKGAPDVDLATGGPADSADPSDLADFLATGEGVHLTMAFTRIRSGLVRKRIIALIEALADDRERHDGD